MTNEAIRAAAAIEFAAEQAERVYVLTADAEFFYPAHANQLLAQVDAMQGSVRMAPLTTTANGQAVPDMAHSFVCFHEDVREAKPGIID